MENAETIIQRPVEPSSTVLSTISFALLVCSLSASSLMWRGRKFDALYVWRSVTLKRLTTKCAVRITSVGRSFNHLTLQMKK